MNRHFFVRAAVLATLLSGAATVSAQTVLKIGYTPPRESHYGVGATVFCDAITKGTANRYTCQQFPASALGGEREMVESVQLGTQDLVISSTGPLGNFVPETKILDIPFLFRDYDHARKVLDGPIGQDLLKKMPAKGLVGLAWTENGFRHMTNNKRPIHSADRCRRPEGAHDGEQGPHGWLQELRAAAHADGLSGAVRCHAAGHGRRPGEPDPGDSCQQVRAGAEALVTDRPCLLAGGSCWCRCACGTSCRRPTGQGLPRRSARPLSRRNASA